MFLYLIRNVYHGLDALRLPALSILDTARVTLRVRPFDLDYNLHQNNARYLESFEMARFSMIVRTGIFKAMIDKRTSICCVMCFLTVRRSDARCGWSLCALHCAAPPLGKVRGHRARGGLGRAVALHGADNDQVRTRLYCENSSMKVAACVCVYVLCGLRDAISFIFVIAIFSPSDADAVDRPGNKKSPVAARAVMRTTFLKNGKMMAPADLFAMVGVKAEPVNMPEWLARYDVEEAAAFKAIASNEQSGAGTDGA